MHGIIFAELKKFVHANMGPDGWQRVAEKAGNTRAMILATTTYPDEELFALVGAAVSLTGIPAPQLLGAFGEFIVPDLLTVYGAFVKRDWTALDLLEHTEKVIHQAVRLKDPSAAPPQLRITRPRQSQVVIHYSSPRRLCAVGLGIMRGIGAHYKEPIVVEETGCMLSGAKECTLLATRSDTVT